MLMFLTGRSLRKSQGPGDEGGKHGGVFFLFFFSELWILCPTNCQDVFFLYPPGSVCSDLIVMLFFFVCVLSMLLLFGVYFCACVVLEFTFASAAVLTHIYI